MALSRATRGSLPTQRVLRHLLLGVVFFFVILPLLIYNFFALEMGQPPRAFRKEIYATANVKSALGACYNVPSSDLLHPDSRQYWINECNGKPASSSHEKPLVHFVYVPLSSVGTNASASQDVFDDGFSFLDFAAMRSARSVLEPYQIYLHYVDYEPKGRWYSYCQRFLSRHQVQLFTLPPHLMDEMGILKVRQLQELLIMLRLLKQYGGIAYAGFHTITLQSQLDRLNSFPLVAGQSGWTSDASGSTFDVSLNALVALDKNSVLISKLEQQLLKLVKAADSRLVQESLETVVGSLVADMTDSKKALVASSDLLSCADKSSFTAFLDKEADESVRQIVKRCGALYVPREIDLQGDDVVREREARQQLLNRVKSSETAAQEASLMGRIIRYATSANATSELF